MVFDRRSDARTCSLRRQAVCAVQRVVRQPRAGSRVRQPAKILRRMQAGAGSPTARPWSITGIRGRHRARSVPGPARRRAPRRRRASLASAWRARISMSAVAEAVAEEIEAAGRRSGGRGRGREHDGGRCPGSCPQPWSAGVGSMGRQPWPVYCGSGCSSTRPRTSWGRADRHVSAGVLHLVLPSCSRCHAQTGVWLVHLLHLGRLCGQALAQATNSAARGGIVSLGRGSAAVGPQLLRGAVRRHRPDRPDPRHVRCDDPFRPYRERRPGGYRPDGWSSCRRTSRRMSRARSTRWSATADRRLGQSVEVREDEVRRYAGTPQEIAETGSGEIGVERMAVESIAQGDGQGRLPRARS